MIQSLSLGILSLLSLFFMGWGFSMVFLPDRTREKAFWLVPWFGTILIVVLGLSLNMSKIPINKAIFGISVFKGLYMILLIGAFLFIISIFVKKKTKILKRENIIFLIFFAFSIFLFSTGLPDKILAQKSTFLMNKSLIEEVINNKKLSYDSYQIGMPVVIAFLSGLLKVDTFSIVAVLPQVYLFLIFLLLISQISRRYNLNMNIFIFITIFAAVRFLIKFFPSILTLNFIVFLGVLFILGVLFVDYFRESVEAKGSTYSFNGYDLLLSSGLSSLSSIYPPGFKIVLSLFALLFLLTISFEKRNLLWFIFAKIILIALIINPITFGFAFSN